MLVAAGKGLAAHLRHTSDVDAVGRLVVVEVPGIVGGWLGRRVGHHHTVHFAGYIDVAVDDGAGVESCTFVVVVVDIVVALHHHRWRVGTYQQGWGRS